MSSSTVFAHVLHKPSQTLQLLSKNALREVVSLRSPGKSKSLGMVGTEDFFYFLHFLGDAMSVSHTFDLRLVVRMVETFSDTEG